MDFQETRRETIWVGPNSHVEPDKTSNTDPGTATKKSTRMPNCRRELGLQRNPPSLPLPAFISSHSRWEILLLLCGRESEGKLMGNSKIETGSNALMPGIKRCLRRLESSLISCKWSTLNPKLSFFGIKSIDFST